MLAEHRTALEDSATVGVVSEEEESWGLRVRRDWEAWLLSNLHKKAKLSLIKVISGRLCLFQKVVGGAK